MADICTGYVYKKNIDWSVLHQGITIPVTIQKQFIIQTNSFLKRGQSKIINIIFNGKTYQAKLVNQLFDRDKYKNRTDIVQIRYERTSDIAIEIRRIFNKSFEYLKVERDFAKESGIRKVITLPDEIKESIALYLTDYPDTYIMECFTTNDYKIIQESIVGVNEQDFEYSVDYNMIDDKAKIEQKNQLVKVRRLNRAIGECLKELYNHSCQVCGVNISIQYDTSIVESHHIDPFVTSLNNDANNQIVLCPNHHRVMHKAVPEFKREKLLFIYKNGLEEKIVLNNHL